MDLEVKINVETEQLDEAIKKANRLAEIGNKLGLSQSRISRIIKMRKKQLQKKRIVQKHYSKTSIKI